jgi:hypothetical protein
MRDLRPTGSIVHERAMREIRRPMIIDVIGNEIISDERGIDDTIASSKKDKDRLFVRGQLGQRTNPFDIKIILRPPEVSTDHVGNA